jgi:hypothetical protein
MTSFQFIVGFVVGVFCAQRYNLPDVGVLALTFTQYLRTLESTTRKPEEKKDNSTPPVSPWWKQW